MVNLYTLPAYYHLSVLYNSFDLNFTDCDSNDICVPQQCLYTKLTVDSSNDLEQILNTAIFWSFSELPDCVFDFICNSLITKTFTKKLWKCMRLYIVDINRTTFAEQIGCIFNHGFIIDSTVYEIPLLVLEREYLHLLRYLMNRSDWYYDSIHFFSSINRARKNVFDVLKNNWSTGTVGLICRHDFNTSVKSLIASNDFLNFGMARETSNHPLARIEFQSAN